MRSFSGRYSYFLLLLVIFLVCEILLNPIGDFPLNDDWSYGKAVYYSLNRNYTIGHFGAMTLFTHIAWGALFVKVFGFSFTVLRFSTLLSALIGLFFLERLVYALTNNKIASFAACLVLLVNPLYFNLSNTFMTDVNFSTLLIVCCYCAFRFFETRSALPFILFFVFSILLVLLRQFGIVLPVCFVLACLFLKEKKIPWLCSALAGTALVYLSLHWYEAYLKEILPPGASYKFSEGIHLGDEKFWQMLKHNFKDRHKVLLAQLCVYAAPLAAFYLVALTRKFRIRTVLLVFAFSICFVLWFFDGVEFPFHNVFQNMWLGPETFYESLGMVPHNQSEKFSLVAVWIKYIFSAVTLATLLFGVLFLLRKGKEQGGIKIAPGLIFLLAFMAAYTCMLFITESYFDRYYIPLIVAFLVLVSLLLKEQQADLRPALLFMAMVLYVSLAGTKDYFSWNRLRWEAYTYLKENKGMSAERVNGGFELNCWNDGKENWWYNYTTLDDFSYLIQFREEPGFRLVKSYEFQRYFPCKKDKINIFARPEKQ